MPVKIEPVTAEDYAECHRLMSALVTKTSHMLPRTSAGLVERLDDPTALIFPYMNVIRVCVMMVEHLMQAARRQEQPHA